MQSRLNTVQDEQGRRLTEQQEIIGRWTEHCSELYNHQINGTPAFLRARNQRMTMTSRFCAKK